MKKTIRAALFAVLLALWGLLSITLWFGPKTDYSYAERRKLTQLPELSTNAVFGGSFAEKFEDFTLDQFPLRDAFRKVKSIFHYYALRQSDNNGIYLVEDTVAKLEYPLNEASVDYATGRLKLLYRQYLQETDCRIYAAIIPDKGYYIAEANGYPAMDYEAMEKRYREELSFAGYIDIKEDLSVEDYYRTDTHWRQERLLDVAHTLCEVMNTRKPIEAEYTFEMLDKPFYGVYFGQAALPLQPDEMMIARSCLLADCAVTDPITGAVTQIYNMDKLDSPDLYDVYLSGAQPILTVENPHGEAGRELVIFRDSYGSSLAPLLLQGYSKVTLVDIRYIHPEQIGSYVNFCDQDVLFLYSTLILNSGRSLK